jgi:hypothetical protein
MEGAEVMTVGQRNSKPRRLTARLARSGIGSGRTITTDLPRAST